jgi:transcriptional regulator with XRE-family HTH domain
MLANQRSTRMTNSTNNEPRKGEFRNLTPAEIGTAIRMLRETLERKQSVLARQANITDRTLQRAEAGEKVNEESLARIAEALGLDRRALIGPRYIPTEEEAEESSNKLVAEWNDNWVVVDIAPVQDVRCLDRLFCSMAVTIGDDHVLPIDAEMIAEFKSAVDDWGNVYSDMSASEQLPVRRSVLEQVRKIEAKGYAARLGTYEMVFGPQSMAVAAAVVIFYPISNSDACELKKVIAPKRLKLR